MKFFRGLLTIVFAWIIVFWLWKWYATDNSIEKTDIMQPVRDKLATLVTKKQEKTKKVITTPPAINTNKAFHPDLTQWTITQEIYDELLWNNKSIWPDTAEWTLFNYCDFDSVYCKQMVEEWTLSDYQLISKDTIKIVHKSYVTAFTWLESTYNTHALYQNLFDFPFQTMKELITEWEELWIDWFSECLVWEDNTFASTFDLLFNK